MAGPPVMVPPARPKPQARTTAHPVQFGKVATSQGHRIVLYGPGGIGKTTLAAMAPGPVAFIDLDDSLPRLWGSFAEQSLDVRPVADIETWQQLREALHAPGWDEIRTVVIDSGTKAEELDVVWTLANVPHEKGTAVKRVEDYGYGKGFTHIYDTFMHLLADLDTHVKAGRNVVIVCHDCTATVANPSGEDWIRAEPRLQTMNSGKASIRLRVREWADHVLCLQYDVDVSADGKGRGAGSRTCYPTELPHCMAKSRTASEPIVVQRFDSSFWSQIIK